MILFRDLRHLDVVIALAFVMPTALHARGVDAPRCCRRAKARQTSPSIAINCRSSRLTRKTVSSVPSSTHRIAKRSSAVCSKTQRSTPESRRRGGGNCSAAESKHCVRARRRPAARRGDLLFPIGQPKSITDPASAARPASVGGPRRAVSVHRNRSRRTSPHSRSVTGQRRTRKVGPCWRALITPWNANGEATGVHAKATELHSNDARSAGRIRIREQGWPAVSVSTANRPSS